MRLPCTRQKYYISHKRLEEEESVFPSLLYFPRPVSFYQRYYAVATPAVKKRHKNRSLQSRSASAVMKRRQESMAGQSWLESSLQRSSKLGLEVLERAKRRSVDWSTARQSSQKHHEVQEGPPVSLSLENAFAKIVEHMAETTRQCEMFYKSAGAAKSNGREKAHVCRFHSHQRPQTSTVASKRPHYTDLTEPEDFFIEVSPGTYAITAAIQEVGPQTRVVRVNAGESKRLTFNL